LGFLDQQLYKAPKRKENIEDLSRLNESLALRPDDSEWKSDKTKDKNEKRS